jgi:putative photosynthetic complex assembly protein 2
MGAIAFSLLVAASVWWASTGVLFWRMGKSPDTYYSTVLAATIAMGAGTIAVLGLREDTGTLAAYGGFLAGIAIWAWHEALFLTGYLAGPRRTPCPEGLSTWHRFLVSTKVVIHHELAIAAHGALLVALSWGAANQIAAWTFLLLWGMRLNAKLVVFLGAPNISDEFLPSHLTYLSSYFGKRRVTAFFPVFITMATAAATALTYTALLQTAGSGLAIGLMLISALAWLAVLEHWALVLPIRDGALWRWAQPKTSKPQQLDKNQKIGGPNGL